jgi:hypothetical protein
MATICQEQEGRLCASVAQAAQQELNQQKDAWHPQHGGWATTSFFHASVGKADGPRWGYGFKWISYDLMG